MSCLFLDILLLRFGFVKRKLSLYYSVETNKKNLLASLTMACNSVVSYKTGDLFSCQDNECLAHCVSSDIHKGKGIATKFKELFGRVDELKRQNQQEGGCAVHRRASICLLSGNKTPLLQKAYL